jgi:hypothetical protein
MADLAPTVSRHVLAAPASAAAGESRWRVVARTAFPFLVVAVLWAFTAYLGIFPRKAVSAAGRRRRDLSRPPDRQGIPPHHVLDTLIRLAAGLRLPRWRAWRSGWPWDACAGRRTSFFRWSASARQSGPRLHAAVPLWFGLGNKTTVLLGRICVRLFRSSLNT